MLPAPAFVVGTLVLLLPALVLAWCAALRRRERDRLAVERILRLQRRIDAALNDGFDGDSRRDFAALLHTASLTTDLQARRLRLQPRRGSGWIQRRCAPAWCKSWLRGAFPRRRCCTPWRR